MWQQPAQWSIFMEMGKMFTQYCWCFLLGANRRSENQITIIISVQIINLIFIAHCYRLDMIAFFFFFPFSLIVEGDVVVEANNARALNCFSQFVGWVFPTKRRFCRQLAEWLGSQISQLTRAPSPHIGHRWVPISLAAGLICDNLLNWYHFIYWCRCFMATVQLHEWEIHLKFPRFFFSRRHFLTFYDDFRSNCWWQLVIWVGINTKPENKIDNCQFVSRAVSNFGSGENNSNVRTPF